MNRVFQTLILLFVLNFANAQDAAFKADVLKIIQSTGATASMDVAKKQILEVIPESKHAAFLIEFDQNLPGLYDKIAAIYMQEFTHADIKAILAFYETPVGKKMGSKAGKITELSMTAGQEWGQSLQGMMMKYMQ